MSSSGERTHLKVVTVGDFDPQSDKAIEYDFIGRVIAGRYTIAKQIGGGGMADVFQAIDEELGVDVAIKLLKPRMASDELRARMVQEARAAAQVRHELPVNSPDAMLWQAEQWWTGVKSRQCDKAVFHLYCLEI